MREHNWPLHGWVCQFQLVLSMPFRPSSRLRTIIGVNGVQVTLACQLPAIRLNLHLQHRFRCCKPLNM